MLVRVLAVVVYLSVCRPVCLSVCVCVCVCLSVCHTPVLYQTAKRRIMQIPPRDSPRTQVFWHQQSLVDDPTHPEICALTDLPPSNTTISINIAHSASTVRAGKNN